MHSPWVISALVALAVSVSILLQGCDEKQSPGANHTGSPVARHGHISVAGNKVVDQSGKPVRLQGMSLFWSQWMGKYYNKDVIQWLASDWKVQLVRAAMGVDKDQGYLMNPEVEKEKVEIVVEAAISAGIYVIIDWHEENAEKHVASAKTFFSEMAQKYGDKPNVFFEPFNEPVHQSWAEIKDYHEEIVVEIRKYSGNLIILGTPTWSQEVDVASKDPVQGTNLAYTLHFYAGDAPQQLWQDRADAAMRNGTAIFVTEWGTCNHDGGGAVNATATQAWMDYLEKHSISSANWAIDDKSEACAALMPGAAAKGAWPSDALSKSGALVRSIIRRDSVPLGRQTPTPLPLLNTSGSLECPAANSDCRCNWTGDDAVSCGSDDGSQCWCVCCCPSQKSCRWATE